MNHEFDNDVLSDDARVWQKDSDMLSVMCFSSTRQTVGYYYVVEAKNTRSEYAS